MGTHPIFESDFDCLTDLSRMSRAALAMGPMARPTGMIGSNWAATVKINSIAYVAGWIASAYWYVAWKTEHDPENDRNIDLTAKFNRVRERGIMHFGEEAPGSAARYAAPASWQVGYDKWAATRAAEEEMVNEHIEEHGITKNKGGWVTPFNSIH